MIKIYKKQKKSKGVTLVELLVAVAVFGSFMAVISGLLVSNIQAQRRILVTQELLSQSSYVLEYIGRAIRMAVKDDATLCLGQPINYLVGPQSIRLLKSTRNGKICQEFYLDPGDNKLYENKSPDSSNNFVDNFPLISGDIKINDFKVSVSGDNDPVLQPRVTIFLDLEGKAISIGQPRVKVQTSISERSLDSPR